MLQCTECGHKQQSGKFCGKCGSQLELVAEEKDTQEEKSPDTETNQEETKEKKEAILEEETTTTSSSTESDETTQSAPEERQETEGTSSGGDGTDIGELIKEYWEFVIMLLRNPTKAFSLGEDHMKYALINYAVTAILFCISAMLLIRSTFGMLTSESPSYFNMFISVLFVLLLLLSATTLGAFIIENIFIKQKTVKEAITQVGALYTPVFILLIISIITALGGSLVVTPIIWLASLFLLLFILPTLFIFEIGRFHTGDQRIYLAIGTLFVNVLFTYFIIRIVINSLIGSVIEELDRMFIPF